MKKRIGAAAALVLAAGVATAQTGHEGHVMTGAETPATLAYMEINARMHEGMAIDFTGDADVDFVRGMIAHHRGAVEMAELVIEHGTDPEVRALAEGVISAQEAEIGWMEEWLAKHGG